MNPKEPIGGKTSLAYLDPEFIESDAGRLIRILSEYLAPLRALKDAHIHDTVVFFGSARISEPGPLKQYYKDARELAGKVTRWSKDISQHHCCLVVCTGGGGGIMEAANRGAAEAGGRTVGFNIGLPFEQRPNAYLEKDLTFEFHYFFLYAQALVRTRGARNRRVSWRLWNARLAVRDPHAEADSKARALDLHRSLRIILLA